jgi:hypothetical protein
VVNNIKKFHDLDLKTVFLRDFADESVFKRFVELDASARELPFSGFVPCFPAALGKKDLSVGVENNSANTHADVIDAFFHNPKVHPSNHGS